MLTRVLGEGEWGKWRKEDENNKTKESTVRNTDQRVVRRDECL